MRWGTVSDCSPQAGAADRQRLSGDCPSTRECSDSFSPLLEPRVCWESSKVGLRSHRLGPWLMISFFNVWSVSKISPQPQTDTSTIQHPPGTSKYQSPSPSSAAQWRSSTISGASCPRICWNPMACASQALMNNTMISANSSLFNPSPAWFFNRPRRKQFPKLFTVRASTEDSDCNEEECAPDKEVGKSSVAVVSFQGASSNSVPILSHRDWVEFQSLLAVTNVLNFDVTSSS